ncbi:hypothetical protein HFO56_39255 [Rhizobium laguerreae]|uniref:hypothetical protein n=1 Tax=Rhizobium laguerreae TaxID=1076926 RepID=UPI001C923679|nr:hypothetical protein [Rhizobium laguerreae]MBY3158339.1 hypothetical protein [Rhizobium laguerreae]
MPSSSDRALANRPVNPFIPLKVVNPDVYDVLGIVHKSFEKKLDGPGLVDPPLLEQLERRACPQVLAIQFAVVRLPEKIHCQSLQC